MAYTEWARRIVQPVASATVTLVAAAATMAWMSSGRTNKELVERLAAAGYAGHPRVVDAMLHVDRGWFCKHLPYEDHPVSIGHGATISAPHMHGHALTHLEPYLQPGAVALDVGSGSGYLVACMAYMVGPTGTVVGVEHVDALTAESRVALDRATQQLPNKLGAMIVVTGDGRKGFPERAPYDCIHVGAAASSRPDALLEQLKPGGALYTPEVIHGGEQVIMLYKRLKGGGFERKELLPVRYVPLTDLDRQLRDAY